MLRIMNLVKSFNDKRVLDNLSIEIEEGSVFGLIGINGAGKSTLLRCISGVYAQDSGVIEVDNECVFDNPRVKEEIIYVSDDPYFPVSGTIKSLKVFYGSFYHLDEELYQKYLNLFGLNENGLISSFSKGMKRQVALLFAMAISPRYLLLDECFDGLDPLVRLKFKKALTDLIDDKQITVIISSHNLKELEDICDSFGILENGRIDTYGDLLSSKTNINKYQLAYNEEKKKDDFKDFDVMSIDITGRVVSLVIKGEKEKVMDKLNKTRPLFIDVLPVNFEELFIYEMEARNNE
ncbi:MAG: ABC transporter ATP-binding protein [Erysipelotrichaceae bacterium]